MKLSKYSESDLVALGWTKAHPLQWQKDGLTLYRDSQRGYWRIDNGRRDKKYATTLDEVVDRLLAAQTEPKAKVKASRQYLGGLKRGRKSYWWKTTKKVRHEPFLTE
jgi:hypothetical protein